MLTLVDARETDERCSTEQKRGENAPTSRMLRVQFAYENGGRRESGTGVTRWERREGWVCKPETGLELIGVTGGCERAFPAHDALCGRCEPAAYQDCANDLASGVRHRVAPRASPDRVERGSQRHWYRPTNEAADGGGYAEAFPVFPSLRSGNESRVEQRDRQPGPSYRDQRSARIPTKNGKPRRVVA